ncbi:MAG: branched-chain amino acid ABC transporter permease [Planctomycetota bacterium]|jgi:branched-chain amino acid transport system permease protein|nr:branched-chain amino acid ABC transporter permease [Planctomycetota bacterium]
MTRKKTLLMAALAAAALIVIYLFLVNHAPIKLRRLALTGVMLGCIYGLIALGYSLIYKASGLMSFVQGDIMTIGAFLGLTFFTFFRGLFGTGEEGESNVGTFILSVLLTTAFAFLFGILLEKGTIRKLLNKNVMAIYVVLATIAISYIIQNGAQIIWGGIPLPVPSVFTVLFVQVIGVRIQPEMVLCVILSAGCMIMLHFFMTRTRMGTSLRAAAMDAKAAEACGIDVSLSTGLTWGMAAGLAAIAGILVGPIYGVYTMLGANIGRKGFSAAVIGGYGNMYGAMLGGIILGLAETFVAGYASSTLKNLIAYILLIAFLFIKPTGIFNERAIQDV